MSRRALSLAALCLAAAAAPVAAQELVRVRAGEHARYTRIVVDAPRGLDWRWGVDGRALIVDAPGAEFAFNTAPADAARGLSRIAGFAAESGAGGPRMRAELTCDCGARATTLADGRIVIDISEGAPRPDAPPGPVAAPALAEAPARSASEAPVAETPAPARPVAPDAAGARASASVEARAPESVEAREDVLGDAAGPAPTGPVRPDRPAAPERVASLPPERPRSPDAAPADIADAGRPARAQEAPPDAAQNAPTPARDEPRAADAGLRAAGPDEAAAASERAAERDRPADPEISASIAEARRRLMEQLTRAAEEGLIEMRDPPADLAGADGDEAAREAAAEAREDGAEAAAEDAEALAAAPLQLRARTADDILRDVQQRNREIAERIPEHCLPDRRLDVAAWASEAPAALQIADMRRVLIGEFDAPRERALTAYARLLIHFGFGLEARAAIESFAADVAPDPALVELASIVDGEAPPVDGALASGVDCPGLHGVWGPAAAALSGSLDPHALDFETMVDTLTRIPGRMRARAALPIADAALDAGRLDLADALTSMVARVEPPPPDGDGMLDVTLARVEFARGEWRSAEALLFAHVGRETPAGVEAMIRLVEFRDARGVRPPEGLAETMEAIAFTQGASPIGRRLLAAAAKARAMGEGLEPALAALSSLADDAGDREQATQAARDMLIDYDPEPEEAASFAEAALEHWDLVGDGPEGDRARVAVARKLVALGLGNLGEDLLAPALARNDPGARLAAAEGAVEAGDYERALGHLDGLPGREAARARAAALAAQFRYDDAVAAAAEAGDPELEARYAWLAGNWDAAARAGDVDRRILAAWMSGEGDLPPELKEAIAADPELAERYEPFAGRDAASAAAAQADGFPAIDAAADALDAAERRRALLGELLGDG